MLRELTRAHFLQQARTKLAHFAALNKRFAAHLQRCPPDVFLKMGRVYREVAGTERRVDGFIEALRKEELRESECGKEIDGCVSLARLGPPAERR